MSLKNDRLSLELGNGARKKNVLIFFLDFSDLWLYCLFIIFHMVYTLSSFSRQSHTVGVNCFFF